MIRTVAALFVLGAAVKFFWWVVAAATIMLVIRHVARTRRRRRAAAQQLAWRCDVENAMYLGGDMDRGMYGLWDGRTV